MKNTSTLHLYTPFPPGLMLLLFRGILHLRGTGSEIPKTPPCAPLTWAPWIQHRETSCVRRVDLTSLGPRLLGVSPERLRTGRELLMILATLIL